MDGQTTQKTWLEHTNTEFNQTRFSPQWSSGVDRMNEGYGMSIRALTSKYDI